MFLRIDGPMHRTDLFTVNGADLDYTIDLEIWTVNCRELTARMHS